MLERVKKESTNIAYFQNLTLQMADGCHRVSNLAYASTADNDDFKP
jgi:hypothetical protein